MRTCEPLPSSGRLWKTVLVVLILLVGLGSLWGELYPYPEFSDDEKRQVQRVDGRLDSLLPTVDDLDDFPSAMTDCTRPDIRSGRDYDLEFFNLSGGQQVEEIINADSDAQRGDREFCDAGGSTWIGVSVGLARDKITIEYWRNAHADFADGDENDLGLLSRAFAEDFEQETVVEEASWVDSPSLGRYGYGSKYLISYPEWPGEPTYAYYDFNFLEGVVTGGMTISYPESSDGEDDAISLVAAFYQRVHEEITGASVEAR